MPVLLTIHNIEEVVGGMGATRSRLLQWSPALALLLVPLLFVLLAVGAAITG